MNRLGLLEFNVIKTCNMNCKGCNHFSTISKSPDLISVDTLQKDLSRMKEIGVEIQKIGLLGGEPLLVKNLEEYIIKCKEIYPDSEIQVTTNGLLVFNMSDILVQTLAENKVDLVISLYPHMTNKRKVHRYLKKKGVIHHFWVFKEQFCKLLSFDEHNEPPKKYCIAASPTLEKGLLYICPISAYVNKLNERFDYKFPTNECIDIYSDNVNAQLIYDFTHGSIELCKYCCQKNPAVYKWENSYKNKVDGTDWVTLDNDIRYNDFAQHRREAYNRERRGSIATRIIRKIGRIVKR